MSSKTFVIIGKRFAELQIKVGLLHLIKNFIVEIDKKTIVPLEIDPLRFLMAAKGGIWLNFRKHD